MLFPDPQLKGAYTDPVIRVADGIYVLSLCLILYPRLQIQTATE